MLPVQRRVRRREDFTAAVRGGVRSGCPGLVMHLSNDGTSVPARAGFIVGRSVGPAVRRNRVRRQLQHVIAPRLDRLPLGTAVVVRATPAAVALSSRELAAGVDRLLDRASRAVAS
jgi:ribonuclease P protein component